MDFQNNFIYFRLHWVFVVSWAFSSCRVGSAVSAHRLLIVVASLVAEHGP